MNKSLTLSFDDRGKDSNFDLKKTTKKEQQENLHNFRPKINPNSAKIIKENKPKEKLTPYQRLYQEAESR